MRVPSGKWPSAGVLLVAFSYLMLAGFVAFGFRTPRLERFWELVKQLRIGQVECLQPADWNLVEEVLQSHPAIAGDLLEGRKQTLLSAHHQGWCATACAVLLRAPSTSPGQLRLQLEAPGKSLPLKLRIHGRSWSRELTASNRGLLELELAPAGSLPEVIQIDFDEAMAGDSTEPIRLKVEGAE